MNNEYIKQVLLMLLKQDLITDYEMQKIMLELNKQACISPS